MVRHFYRLIKDSLINPFTNSSTDLTYIVEASNWSIDQDGYSITKALNNSNYIRARVSVSSIGIRNQIIHFGSVNTFFKKGAWKKPHSSNRIILTWFHVVPGDPRLLLIYKAQATIERIHTSCQSTKETLIKAGVDEKKIVVIPLGVDLKMFVPITDVRRKAIRKQLNISPERLVIGSFQKDGVGWGEGLEPKLIKGPDIFVETVSKLKNLNPLILLTGPARGYVKRKLEEQGIEYQHHYFKDFHKLPELYHALDLYLITSRIEGGPKAVLEAWASGIPVVSTRVGMVPDIGENSETILMCDNKNTISLTKTTKDLLANPKISLRLTTNALREITHYSWQEICKRYIHDLYKMS